MPQKPTPVPDTRSFAARRRARRRPAGMQPVVPDHTILREIGTGAYGEVWLARSVTGAYRAVKVVWAEDFPTQELFFREFEGILNYEPVARGLAGMVHILHVGRHGGEFPHYFYVMELADDAYTGAHIDPQNYVPRTLQSDRNLYGNRPMPLDYVLEAGCQLARALVGLHAVELTHRDVKPANVVFLNGRLKLADPGLVAGAEQRAFVGTEGYVPPEGPGTPRADVYALAKMLYEMATGHDRMRFPELPDELPAGADRPRWLRFNELICRAAEPVVSRRSIVTAQSFAEQLEVLRDDRPQRRSKAAHPWRRAAWVALPAAAVGALWYLLPQDMPTRLHKAMAALTGQQEPAPPAPEPPPATGQGLLFIGSSPAGASIYTEQGEYVDETPYGPVPVEAGKRLSFILRKDGYADAAESGIAESGKLLSLGGELHPYRPPRTGETWQDAQGTEYSPAGGIHEARTPVTAAQFREFLQSAGDDVPPQLRYETVGEKLYTTQEGISAFALWLTGRCEESGSIGQDHSLVAQPEAGTGQGADMCSYRLRTMPVEKTPVTIYTNPAGATVNLNGRPLGVTPMQDTRIPLAPYYLEIRMPGYRTERRSGLSPKDLVLNLMLQPSSTVVFGTAWVNSLGMRLQPLTPTLMAAATEVRVSDYRAFCDATAAAMPAAPPFARNEHHPVVGVSRTEAEAFAKWLTAKERAAGMIGAADSYRLPTDAEWSAMAGCKEEQGDSPYERQRLAVSTGMEYPWGHTWPPARATGNFADMSAVPPLRMEHVIQDYYDEFPYTAPVGSFAPNAQGLHDLAGNAQEWVSDEYGGPAGFRFRRYGVTRGGDYTSFRPGQLSLHSRIPHPAGAHLPTIGFRVVLEHKL